MEKDFLIDLNPKTHLFLTSSTGEFFYENGIITTRGFFTKNDFQQKLTIIDYPTEADFIENSNFTNKRKKSFLCLFVFVKQLDKTFVHFHSRFIYSVAHKLSVFGEKTFILFNHFQKLIIKFIHQFYSPISSFSASMMSPMFIVV